MKSAAYIIAVAALVRAAAPAAVKQAAAGEENLGFVARVKKATGGCCDFGGGGGFGGIGGLGGGCFPADTEVLTPAGPKPISEVDAGDKVYVTDEEGAVRLDTVYLQAHKAGGQSLPYVRVLTAGGRRLHLSREHYLYVDGAMVQGQDVQVGDQVSVMDPSTMEMVSDQVREVTVNTEPGVYNPWTLSGHLLTSGVHSSAYSADTRPFSPAALHAIFWPLRQLTKMADITFQGSELTEGQPAWLASLECLLHSANHMVK